jgi:LacI family transcriptional regulator, gluconate utilization system Gnt-I transcriptional repressor
MKKKATLAEVAAAAGVSKMTASRALRDGRDVSAANVIKVRKAAQDLGYVGNHLAASLSSRRSDLIGVVVPNLANIVFAQVLSGISEGISGSGIQPVFGVTDYDLEKEYDIIRSMLSWHPAGLIVTGLDQSEPTRRLLENAGIPVVQIMDLDGEPVDACVGFSHVAAGGAIADALLEVGRQRFGYVGCGLEFDTRAAKRLKGFRAALQRQELDFAEMATSPELSSISRGRKLTCELLEKCGDLDCIYFSNDDMAAGGLFYCLDAGIPIPEKVVLAGFNGLDVADGFPGRIATSRTPRREIGSQAASLLMTSLSKQRGELPAIIELVPKVDLGFLIKGQLI